MDKLMPLISRAIKRNDRVTVFCLLETYGQDLGYTDKEARNFASDCVQDLMPLA